MSKEQQVEYHTDDHDCPKLFTNFSIIAHSAVDRKTRGVNMLNRAVKTVTYGSETCAFSHEHVKELCLSQTRVA
jgi:hypothetical protein